MHFEWLIFDGLRATSHMEKTTKNRNVPQESSLVRTNTRNEELANPIQKPDHLVIGRFKKTFKDDISLSEYQGSKKTRLWKLLKKNLSFILICTVVFLLLLFFIYSPIPMHRVHFF